METQLYEPRLRLAVQASTHGVDVPSVPNLYNVDKHSPFVCLDCKCFLRAGMISVCLYSTEHTGAPIMVEASRNYYHTNSNNNDYLISSRISFMQTWWGNWIHVWMNG